MHVRPLWCQFKKKRTHVVATAQMKPTKKQKDKIVNAYIHTKPPPPTKQSNICSLFSLHIKQVAIQYDTISQSHSRNSHTVLYLTTAMLGFIPQFYTQPHHTHTTTTKNPSTTALYIPLWHSLTNIHMVTCTHFHLKNSGMPKICYNWSDFCFSLERRMSSLLVASSCNLFAWAAFAASISLVSMTIRFCQITTKVIFSQHDNPLLSNNRIFSQHDNLLLPNNHIFGQHRNLFLSNSCIFGQHHNSLLSNNHIFGQHHDPLRSNNHIFGQHNNPLLSNNHIFIIINNNGNL